MMPKITAYHPELAVQKPDGSILVVKPDMDDWYSDREILEMMGEAAGVGTVGELVEALQKKKGNTPSCVLSCRIEKGDERYQLRHMWDDPI